MMTTVNDLYKTQDANSYWVQMSNLDDDCYNTVVSCSFDILFNGSCSERCNVKGTDNTELYK